MNPRSHSKPGPASARGQTREAPQKAHPPDAALAADAEAWVLSSPAGRQLLDEVAKSRSLGPAQLTRLRQHAPAEAVAAAVRLTLARRKAATKFARGALMWVDPTGVEQATAEPVAVHKASRFRCALVADLCAGIGGDTLALAARSSVLSVDLDHGMCRRIRFNAAVYGVADKVLPIRAQDERFPIPAGAWVHLDPDRRASTSTSRRAARLADYRPGPAFWNTLIKQAPAGAIKLGPASDFANHFAHHKVEFELISLRGECKEATIWFGELGTCRRRATRLPENVSWTDHDNPTSAQAPIGPPGAFIYDPDPSLVRAGLVDSFACAHKLVRLAEGVGYLTADDLVRSPFLAAFEVREISSLDPKALKRMIARHEIGTLEIKVRGVDVTPEALRAKLKPRGTQTATLLVSDGSKAVMAVLAQRVSTGGLATSS
jgi:hypothetical protein